MNDVIIKKSSDLDVLRSQDLSKSLGSVKWWEREYIKDRLELIENKNHKMLFMFLWKTGVRISEALGVRKKDVDLVNYTVEIRWLKKRRYETRLIPLHPELRNLLDYFMSSLKADEKLFPFSRQRADQVVRKYFSGSCHQFRHSFAINWLRCGGDLYVLSKMLGHSSITVTEIYLKIVPRDIGKELLKINF